MIYLTGSLEVAGVFFAERLHDFFVERLRDFLCEDVARFFV